MWDFLKPGQSWASLLAPPAHLEILAYLVLIWVQALIFFRMPCEAPVQLVREPGGFDHKFGKKGQIERKVGTGAGERGPEAHGHPPVLMPGPGS